MIKIRNLLCTTILLSLLTACGGSSTESPPTPELPAPVPLPNQAPIVMFDDEYVFNEGEEVSVVLEISDTDGSIDSTFWEPISDPNLSFDITTNSISFTAPQTNEDSYLLVFRLTATDDDGEQTIVDINIRILNINKPPTFVPENEYVIDELTGAIINLGVQDADGSVVTALWQQISGISVEFDSSASVLSFTAPEVTAAGAILEFEITATDDDGASASQTITVTVVDVNNAPVAIMTENYSLFLGTGAIFDASDSFDPDGDMLTYQWTVIDPNGNEVTIENANNVSLVFTPEVIGEYIISLVVTDPSDLHDEATGILTVVQGNLPPTAIIITPLMVTTGTLVMLDGISSSDPEKASLTFSWRLVAPDDSTAVLSSISSAQTTFVADVDGSFAVELIVNDGELNSEMTSIVIQAQTLNSAPVANAGPDQRVVLNKQVELNAIASFDIDNDILSYEWQLVSSPDRSPVTLSDTNSSQPTFIASNIGTYVFRVTLDDGQESSSDNVSIVVFNASIIMCDPNGTVNGCLRFAWPFTANSIFVQSSPDPTFKLGQIRIEAIGADYKIKLTAEDRNGLVQPYFIGLEDGQIITDGEILEVEYGSPKTDRRWVDLLFKIEVEGLEDHVWTSNIELLTN